MSQDEIRDEGQPNLMGPDAMARRRRQMKEMEARGERPSATGEELAPHVDTRDGSHHGRREIVTPPPPALDDEAAAVDARIRMKFQRGEPLDEEEKRFLATMPGAQQVHPGQMRRPPDEG